MTEPAAQLPAARPSVNDNAAARTLPAVDDGMAATFLAYVAAATIIGADQVALPLRLAQSIAGQLRHQLGGLIDG